ncbi:protein kinase domain-containing protein [Flindersiella endophytica]
MTTGNDSGATDPQGAADHNTPASRLLAGGRYDLGEVVGTGGMAEVRLGTDRRLGRVVAVKILLAGLATDVTFQERFRREAKAAGKLNHRNIVAVYDTGEEPVPGDGTGSAVQYIVMEYVEGRTLRDILRAENKLPPERAVSIVSDVLAALAYSHRQEIVHRDIKPGNVMVTPANIVKVMDFGIARALGDGGATMTKTSAVIGTAHYLSPEQARGEKVDGRSDIYSTGCLLYELLTGRPPFVGESPVAVLYQHVREDAAPPSSIEPRIPAAIDAITLKALRKIPGERYQTAEEMRADIARALSGQALLPSDPRGIAVPPPGDAPTGELDAAGLPPGGGAAGYPEPAYPDEEPYPQRKRRAWIAVAAAAVLVLGIGGFMFDQLRPQGGGGSTPGGVQETTQGSTQPRETDTGNVDDGKTTEPSPSETSGNTYPDDDDEDTPKPTPTPTSSDTPSPSDTPTDKPEPSDTPTNTDTPEPSDTPTDTPEPTDPPTTEPITTPPTQDPGVVPNRAV